MANEIEKRFDEAMMNIYQRALTEVHYRATRYHRMLCENGGIDTAQILINSKVVSDGYTALWERGRLDLTVEALVLDEQWYSLFTDEELDIARKRLQDYGYHYKGHL